MNLAAELAVALDIARRVAAELRTAYERFEPIADAPAEISTDADRDAQELILRALHESFPRDRLIAEEETQTLLHSPSEAERCWIVDPIDGTRGFAMKNGEFSSMIGLAVNGEVVLGVVVEPIIERRTYATRGDGCWVIRCESAPERCRVSRVDSLSESQLTLSHATPGRPRKAADILMPKSTIETFSAGIKLALVARGEADIYVNTYSGFHDWDVCAGEILVAEAGGAVAELSGLPIRYAQRAKPPRSGFVASNGLLHDAALERWRNRS